MSTVSFVKTFVGKVVVRAVNNGLLLRTFFHSTAALTI